MESCVLIPDCLSLVLEPFKQPYDEDNRLGSINKFDIGVSVRAKRQLKKGCILYPNKGQIELFQYKINEILDKDDVSTEDFLKIFSFFFLSSYFLSISHLKRITKSTLL